MQYPRTACMFHLMQRLLENTQSVNLTSYKHQPKKSSHQKDQKNVSKIF
jgi:hypothetical protein